MISIASLIFLIATVAAATAVDDDNGNNNKTISNGEQECYSDHFEENMQIILQRELSTNNSSASDFDIAIKDGQVCVYMNDNLDEIKSGISQPAPMQDENNNTDRDITIRDFDNENNCTNPANNPGICINQGEGDNKIEDLKIGDLNFDVS
jgi:hypothetical protein